MARWILLLAERPSGLRPWKLLREDRSEPDEEVPLALITRIERAFGPFNRGDPGAWPTVQERFVQWPTEESDQT